jgi:hypothetical protein
MHQHYAETRRLIGDALRGAGRVADAERARAIFDAVAPR